MNVAESRASTSGISGAGAAVRWLCVRDRGEYFTSNTRAYTYYNTHTNTHIHIIRLCTYINVCTYDDVLVCVDANRRSIVCFVIVVANGRCARAVRCTVRSFVRVSWGCFETNRRNRRERELCGRFLGRSYAYQYAATMTTPARALVCAWSRFACLRRFAYSSAAGSVRLYTVSTYLTSASSARSASRLRCRSSFSSGIRRSRVCSFARSGDGHGRLPGPPPSPYRDPTKQLSARHRRRRTFSRNVVSSLYPVSILSPIIFTTLVISAWIWK